MLNNLWSLLKRLVLPDPKKKHAKWLTERLPCMMDINDPKLFDSTGYQKEGLLVLVLSAHRVKKALRAYSQQPGNHYMKSDYNLRRNMYTYDVQTLQHAHEAFKGLDLHWDKLPQFIENWQKKNPKVWDSTAQKHVCMLEAA